MKDEITALYAKLPKLNCKGLCHTVCGPISMSAEEWKRLRKAFGPLKIERPGRCPVLDDQNRCSAYEKRPLICRLYGIVETMKCPHGCEPTRWLTDEEGHRLVDEMRRIGGKFRTDLLEMSVSAKPRL